MQFKICVDSSPLLERALAVRAGLGIIGKNRMLVNPRLGPQIFLGEIVTNIELDPDKPLKDSCPGCGKCVAACPTGALKQDGSFDATKCISYLTIEANTDVPAELAPKIGNHLFGCAECLLACPYQQKAPTCTNKGFVHHADRAELDLNDLLNLTEEQFKSQFVRSPILRPGLAHLKKIAGICIKNIMSCPEQAYACRRARICIQNASQSASPLITRINTSFFTTKTRRNTDLISRSHFRSGLVVSPFAKGYGETGRSV